MKKDLRKQVGQAGEQAATEFLINRGWKILDRNWSTRLGELDIIAIDHPTIVFVEVRTTSSTYFGYGFQSVDFRKQQKVRRLALQYIQMKQWDHLPIRFDVISVFMGRDGIPTQVDLIEGAF
ncbi:YraN family protein [Hazenella coriacea]|uniref:UPF0102 protein EDD58_10972 n=1 Tax=Hazenella coriacea TaxID=1179467 RepID=A0A4R3L3C9_9BACL|nr:YraN family protein [Hazenella coriacea]TCS93130.1 putative endonuclease [Hazenella coriacea]